MIPATTAIMKQIVDLNKNELRSNSFALRNANTEPTTPAIQSTKPPASGAATRWHGYTALLGFGITRSKNQKSDTRPATGKIQSAQRNGFLPFNPLLVPEDTTRPRSLPWDNMLHLLKPAYCLLLLPSCMKLIALIILIHYLFKLVKVPNLRQAGLEANN
jgi:hypothetical protein